MVQEVSQDTLKNTLEFNEFLLMMIKQEEEIVKEDLLEAFK